MVHGPNAILSEEPSKDFFALGGAHVFHIVLCKMEEIATSLIYKLHIARGASKALTLRRDL
jgi:hypothetical protein